MQNIQENLDMCVQFNILKDYTNQNEFSNFIDEIINIFPNITFLKTEYDPDDNEILIENKFPSVTIYIEGKAYYQNDEGDTDVILKAIGYFYSLYHLYSKLN